MKRGFGDKISPTFRPAMNVSMYSLHQFIQSHINMFSIYFYIFIINCYYFKNNPHGHTCDLLFLARRTPALENMMQAKYFSLIYMNLCLYNH